MTVSPELLRFAQQLQNRLCPSHHSRAQTVLSFPALLTNGDRWFLASIQRLSALSDRQWQKLQSIEAKVEHGR